MPHPPQREVLASRRRQFPCLARNRCSASRADAVVLRIESIPATAAAFFAGEINALHGHVQAGQVGLRVGRTVGTVHSRNRLGQLMLPRLRAGPVNQFWDAAASIAESKSSKPHHTKTQQQGPQESFEQRMQQKARDKASDLAQGGVGGGPHSFTEPANDDNANQQTRSRNSNVTRLLCRAKAFEKVSVVSSQTTGIF